MYLFMKIKTKLKKESIIHQNHLSNVHKIQKVSKKKKEKNE